MARGEDSATGDTPGPDVSTALAVQLRRAAGEVGRVVHAFAATQDLHPTDVQALALVLDSPEPLTPGRLRERLGLTPGAVTACLDRLERAGHLRRVRDAEDRRVVRLHYEGGARAVAADFFRPVAGACRAAQGGFDEAELGLVLRFLTAVNEELRKVRPPER
ncbi:MarR family winged helix-turn-helix transcriptional regulator [Streptomyces sp. NPDC059740]|uniref:MarR family winged helix-turn-helix transcriptional regulator n=1 Tax=Streptomyces sp. NPDC059740 TaxID=3346926 RepID=UPI0036598EAA